MLKTPVWASCFRPGSGLIQRAPGLGPRMAPAEANLVRVLDAPAPVPCHNLFGLSRQQLTAIVESFGQPSYRAAQLAVAMYRKRAASLDQISPLPRSLREQMAEAGWGIRRVEVRETFFSADGAERYLIAGEDGQTVETVWMPEGDGGEQGDFEGDFDLEKASKNMLFDANSRTRTAPTAPRRATICVSSQIGCAVNCQFCLTAKLGLQRNLSAGEIAGQVLAVLDRQQVEVGRDRINLVFMGMGEPLLNYDAFMAAVRLLVEEVGLPASRMTVSTSGIVPGILRLARETVRPKLALSLNASNDTVREAIMPITRKWPIAEVMAAAATVPLGPRERITFEYVLLGGVNDAPEHAEEVTRLVRAAPFPAKVNLIVWNPGPGIAYTQPEAARVAGFQQRLMRSGVAAFLRRPRGLDIYAACGQLKRTLSL